MVISIKHAKLTSELGVGELLDNTEWDEEHDVSGVAPTESPTFTGTVSGITKAMVGLGNVDNTSDANKPVSTAQQTALDLKAALAGATFTGNTGLTKTGDALLWSYGTTSASLRLGDTSGASNLKYHDIYSNDGTLAIRTLNDDFTTKNTPISISSFGTVTFGMPFSSPGGSFTDAVTVTKTGDLDVTLTSTTQVSQIFVDSGATANFKRGYFNWMEGVLTFVLQNDAFTIKHTPLTINGDGSVLFANATAAQVRLGDTGAGSNLKYHQINADGGVLTFYNLNDNLTVKNTPMSFAADGSVTLNATTSVINTNGFAFFTLQGTSYARLNVSDTGAGSNLKYGHITYDDGALTFRNLNDALTTKNTPLILNADGTSTFGGAITGTSATLSADSGVTKTGAAMLWSFGSTSAEVRLGDTGAGSNLKYHSIFCDGGAWDFANLNDAGTVKNYPMRISAAGAVTFSANIIGTGANFTGDVIVSNSGGVGALQAIGSTSGRLLVGDSGFTSGSRYYAMDVDGGVAYLRSLSDIGGTKNNHIALNADGTTSFTGVTTFAADAGVTKAAGAAYLWSYGNDSGGVLLRDNGAGSNLKTFRLMTDGGVTTLANLNDDFSLKNTPLTFNADGTSAFGSSISATGWLTLVSGSAGLRLNDTTGTANTRLFGIHSESNQLTFNAYNDAGVWQRTMGKFTHAGYFTATYGAAFGAEVTVEPASGQASLRLLGTTDARIVFADTGAAADSRYHMMQIDGGKTYFYNLTDAFAVKNTPIIMHENGITSFGYTAGHGYLEISPGNSTNIGYISFRKPNNSRIGYIGWSDDGHIGVDMEATGGSLFVKRGGLRSEYGWAGKQGYSSSTYGSWHNFWWTGSAIQAWVDTVNVGTLQFVSDARFKKSIKTLAGKALERIMAVRPVSFRWRDHKIFKDDKKDHVGFVAQELVDVIPDAVTKGEDEDETLAINPTPIIATLVKAMQEMADKIATLEARLADARI